MTTSATQPHIPVGIALPGLVIAIALIGDALIYVVLPLYHQEFGVSLAMVGVLLSLNRWIRLLANSAVAHLGERIGPHALMIAAAVGSIVSTSLYGLAEGAALQVVARCLWGISFAALNLSSLAYAVNDRANAGKRVGMVRALIGVVQIMALVGGAWLVLAGGLAPGLRDLRRHHLARAGRGPAAAAPAARAHQRPGLQAAAPAQAGDLGVHAGLRGRRRVPADARLPDEGLDHDGGAGAGDGDPAGAALDGRDHHRSARRLDRRPLRRAPARDRQRRDPGRGLLLPSPPATR